MTEQQLYDTLFAETMQSLEFTDVAQPRIVITFFGIPGSGKTELAKRLARDLQAQYIQQDTMRMRARELGFEASIPVHPVTLRAFETILSEHANKRILLDASIEPNPELFFENCEKLHIKPITIRLHTPPEVAAHHLQKRGRHGDEGLLATIADRITLFSAVQEKFPATVNVPWPYDYKKVLLEVEQRLTESQSDRQT